eukprot:6904144-Pyramimonas_sp.AAC.1
MQEPHIAITVSAPLKDHARETQRRICGRLCGPSGPVASRKTGGMQSQARHPPLSEREWANAKFLFRTK